MAANRYDNPVNYEYVDQYVPIPFQELVNLGRYYGEQRRQAEEELADNIKTFGKFVSPSAVDMENYKNASIGKLTPFVEQAAANPNLMKDAAFRAQIQNAINNIDYAELGTYTQSAANLNERLKNIAKLKAAGKYNLNWDDIDVRNWDTKGKGVMNDLTPLEYQSLEQFGSPYVNNLKPRFYKDIDPNDPRNKMAYTNWMAITRDDIARQFAQHVNDIKANPQGSQHYKDITSAYLKNNPNATQEELDAVFVDALTTRQLDKVVSTPVVDQVGLKFAVAKYENERKAGGKKGDDTGEQNVYTTPREQLSNQYQSNFNDYVQRNLKDPTRKDYKEEQNLQQVAYRAAVHSANRAAMLEQAGAPAEMIIKARQQAVYYGEESAKHQLNVNRKEFSNMYGSDKIGPKDFDDFNKDVDFSKFNKVSQDFIDNMGGQITLTDSYNMLKHVATPTKVMWSGGESEGFVLSSSSEFILPSDLSTQVLKINGNVGFENDRFFQALKTGMYKNIKIIPQSKGTSVSDPSSPTGKRELVKVTAVIDPNDVDLSVYPWYTIIPAGVESIYDWATGGHAERITKELGGKYNSDTGMIELEGYVPIGETNQQAEDFNFEKNKERFGTTTNTGDRYDYTYRTNQQRLNTGYYGEEE